MQKKKIIILIMMMLLICIFTKSTYASNEAEIKLTIDNTNLTTSDKAIVKMSVVNNSAEGEISAVLGYLNYDIEIFELQTLDSGEIDEKIEAELAELAEIENIYLDAVSIKNDWLLGVTEDDETEETIICALYLNENGGVAQGQTVEIGEFEFEIKDSITKATTNIETYNMVASTAEGNFELTNAHSPDITITGTTGTEGDTSEDEIGGEINEDLQDEFDESFGDDFEDGFGDDFGADFEDEYEEGLGEGSDEEEKQPTTTQQPTKKDNTESNKPLVYTGAEDVIFYIIIASLIAIITYIRWKKYKQI